MLINTSVLDGRNVVAKIKAILQNANRIEAGAFAKAHKFGLKSTSVRNTNDCVFAGDACV